MSLFGLLLAATNNAGAQSNEIKVNGYSDIILFDQPVAYYRFEEATGDKTANLGTFGAAGDGLWMAGDAAGTASTDAGPRPPQFLGFDAKNLAAKLTGSGGGSEWIDTQNQFLNNLPAFSLEYWVSPANRVTDPTAFGTRIGIVGQNDAVEYGFIDQNTVQIWSSGGGSLNTAYGFPDNEWHHVATIADGQTIKNYYDGKLVGTGGSSTANYGSSTYNVHIGGGGVYDATGNFFTGGFDEVAIFDRAIPADRIAQHYQAGKSGAFSVPFIISPLGNLYGFTIDVMDFGTHVADASSIVLKFNGAQVTPTKVSKTGSRTTVSYVAGTTPLPSGSTNTTFMSIKDSSGTLYAADSSFVAPVYGTLGAADALAATAVDKTKPGFKIKTYQTDGGSQANTIQFAENMLAGLNGANVANLQDVTGVDSKGYFTWTGIINFDVTPTAADGHFNDTDYTDNNFPGIPGSPNTGIATENFTEEIFTALEFPTAGVYTLDVNSDDGFLLMSGANPLDTFTGVSVGQYNAGRGATDSFMTLNVTQPGIYPFRLLYFQGGGGGNLEFIIQHADGSLALVNDTTNSIKAYQWLPTGLPAYARTVIPAPNATDVTPNSVVQVVLVDGPSAIDKGTISLKLDGTAVTPTITKAGSVTTITFTPASLFASASAHTATLGYTEGSAPVSRSWKFSVASYRATLDVVAGNAGLIQGPGGFTADQGGHTGQAGDYAIDTTIAGGTWINVLNLGFLNQAAAKDQLSMAFWIKKYDIANGSAFWARLSKVTTGTDLRGFQAHVPWSDDNIYFDTAGCCDTSVQRISSNISNLPGYVNDGFWTNWHHMVFTKNQANKNIYIDGQLFLNGSSTDPLTSDFDGFALLTDGLPGGDYMHGMIDDFAVYAGEVSAADAAKLAKGASPKDVTGLVAYWPFNDAKAASARTYGVGLNFGATFVTNSSLAATDVAGVPAVAQANWNNLVGASGTNSAVVADDNGASAGTSVTVTWTSANLWSSTGSGEENNKFTGADKALMTGYLDTGAATTTDVTIQGIPDKLTSAGYDVYVYAMGGVAAGRSGGYRILDANSKTVLKDWVIATSSSNAAAYAQVPLSTDPTKPGVGNYIVFSGLNAANIIVEASTANGKGGSSTPRAAINAIQLLAPASSVPPPQLSLQKTAAGVSITYQGTLLSAPAVTGPWAPVLGATSPFTPTPGSGQAFFKAQK